MNFEGKRVLVTGGSRGIGRATAQAFREAGAQVAVNGRTAESTADGIAAMGDDGLIAAPGDIGTVAGCEAVVDAALDAFGGLDVLVNSAGVAKARSIETCDEAFWDEVMDINLKGTFFCIRAAAAALRESHGSIVNVASTSGLSGDANLSTYCASKGGVVLLTKALSAEFAPEVRINCVCPGWVDTDMAKVYINNSDDPAAARAEIDADSPMGRIARPDEIAASILYLASDAAGIVTGVVLPIDGGSMASG
ncbi:MAG: glucose 1-dehydrogenase [Proteobacteria bacterium]|nr:glucose 1-dehydrogenase [Pseudomonadota bacterium]MCH8277553.1 glucose 1-dehydrogenase [Pseudomonadota bacterium]